LVNRPALHYLYIFEYFIQKQDANDMEENPPNNEYYKLKTENNEINKKLKI